jgi:hypothetical protein
MPVKPISVPANPSDGHGAVKMHAIKNALQKSTMTGEVKTEVPELVTPPSGRVSRRAATNVETTKTNPVSAADDDPMIV